jgi:hypothetical protein
MLILASLLDIEENEDEDKQFISFSFYYSSLLLKFIWNESGFCNELPKLLNKLSFLACDWIDRRGPPERTIVLSDLCTLPGPFVLLLSNDYPKLF